MNTQSDLRSLFNCYLTLTYESYETTKEVIFTHHTDWKGRCNNPQGKSKHAYQLRQAIGDEFFERTDKSK